jgi:hypothetical protein
VLLVLVLVVVIRSCSKKSINEIPVIQMPLLTSMTMTPNADTVFPLPTDETDPNSTVVFYLGVWLSMSWVHGCLGGRTGVWMHDIVAYGCAWCTGMQVVRVCVGCMGV